VRITPPHSTPSPYARPPVPHCGRNSGFFPFSPFPPVVCSLSSTPPPISTLTPPDSLLSSSSFQPTPLPPRRSDIFAVPLAPVLRSSLLRTPRSSVHPLQPRWSIATNLHTRTTHAHTNAHTLPRKRDTPTLMHTHLTHPARARHCTTYTRSRILHPTTPVADDPLPDLSRCAQPILSFLLISSVTHVLLAKPITAHL
jgi:hypothetical protein